MREVRLPDTSIAAGRLKDEESKQRDYEKICYALGKLGASHYEQISEFLNFSEPNKVSRRLREMLPPTSLNPKGKNLIYNTGAKGVTSRNRAAYLYDLVMPGKSVSEISKDIQLVQKSLFP